jgi:hypothetical protein
MKYIPSFVVRDEDAPMILVDEEGNEHKPHEGEWVRFRVSVPMAVMRLSTMASQVGDLGDDASEEEVANAVQEYGQITDGLIDALQRQILNWNWTDQHWKKYPTPADRVAFRKVLEDLEDYEVGWLMEHMSDGAKLRKNSSSPS